MNPKELKKPNWDLHNADARARRDVVKMLKEEAKLERASRRRRDSRYESGTEWPDRDLVDPLEQ